MSSDAPEDLATRIAEIETRHRAIFRSWQACVDNFNDAAFELEQLKISSPPDSTAAFSKARHNLADKGIEIQSASNDLCLYIKNLKFEDLATMRWEIGGLMQILKFCSKDVYLNKHQVGNLIDQSRYSYHAVLAKVTEFLDTKDHARTAITAFLELLPHIFLKGGYQETGLGVPDVKIGHDLLPKLWTSFTATSFHLWRNHDPTYDSSEYHLIVKIHKGLNDSRHTLQSINSDPLSCCVDFFADLAHYQCSYMIRDVLMEIRIPPELIEMIRMEYLGGNRADYPELMKEYAFNFAPKASCECWESQQAFDPKFWTFRPPVPRTVVSKRRLTCPMVTQNIWLSKERRWIHGHAVREIASDGSGPSIKFKTCNFDTKTCKGHFDDSGWIAEQNLHCKNYPR